MSKKILNFKPGKITLYDSKKDPKFEGSLIVDFQPQPVPQEQEYIEEVPEEAVDYYNQPEEIAGQPEEKQYSVFYEYWNLLDFGLLFRFLALEASNIYKGLSSGISSALKTLVSSVKNWTNKISELTKKSVEFLFYSEDKPKEVRKNAFGGLIAKYEAYFKNLNVVVPRIKIPEYRPSVKISYPKFPEFKMPTVPEFPRFAMPSPGLPALNIAVAYPSPRVFQGFAVASLIVAFVSLGALFLPIIAAQLRPYIVVDTNTEEAQARIDNEYPVAQPDNLNPAAAVLTPQEFKITIPKIDLVSEISPYVDLSQELEYKEELIKTGVAHAKDSYLPGEDGPVFLFAHSTDTIFNIAQFNAKFFYAKDLKPGDEIEIDYKGKKYKYAIDHTVIVEPQNVEAVRQAPADLILMTCTPPGTDWQRLLIFAKEVKGTQS
jgi:LPXTG-site transpeptidase (sortase) family protein